MYVFHDIDGASHANDDGVPLREATGWLGEWIPMTVPGAYPGHVSLELIGELNRITATDGLTNVWLTSWEEQATELYVPFSGLNGADWPVLTGLEENASWDWWKLKVLREFLGEGFNEPFIWIEDDVPFDAAAVQWARSLPVPPLIISPKTREGITRDHIGFIENYIRRHLPTRR